MVDNKVCGTPATRPGYGMDRYELGLGSGWRAGARASPAPRQSPCSSRFGHGCYIPQLHQSSRIWLHLHSQNNPPYKAKGRKHLTRDRDRDLPPFSFLFPLPSSSFFPYLAFLLTLICVYFMYIVW
jgi:hypothetical protein